MATMAVVISATDEEMMKDMECGSRRNAGTADGRVGLKGNAQEGDLLKAMRGRIARQKQIRAKSMEHARSFCDKPVIPSI